MTEESAKRDFFTAEQAARLTELCREYEDKLFPPSRKAQADQVRQEAWKTVTSILNAEFGKNRSVDQVKQKWDNLKSLTKDAVATRNKKKLRVTVQHVASP